MSVTSIHPIDEVVVARYVGALGGLLGPDPEWASWWKDDLPEQAGRAVRGDERAANRVTSGLALALAQAGPVFLTGSLGFTAWEARIDRGIGMLMRPPARLYLDAGAKPEVTRAMPIRVDPGAGPMGGAWIPNRLVPNFRDLLDGRLARTAIRLNEAGYDPLHAIGIMTLVVDHATATGCGLLEANDVLGPDGEAPFPVRVVSAATMDIDQAMRDRIRTALKPPKRPGLFGRLIGRNGSSPDPLAGDPTARH